MLDNAQWFNFKNMKINVIFTLVLGSIISTHWVDMLGVVTATASPRQSDRISQNIFMIITIISQNPPHGGAGLPGQGMVT